LKSYSSRELIKVLRKNGWYLYEIHGSHYQFKHDNNKVKITIPHPKKSLKIKLIKNVLKQAKINPQKENYFK